MTAFLRPTDPGYDDEVAGYNRSSSTGRSS